MRVAAVEDVRHLLSTWSREELLEFAADCAAEFPLVNDRLRRRLAFTGDGATATFRAQIDQALAVRHVKWDEVAEFVASLDAILADVERLGERRPAEAVDVALWLLGRVPSVCDAVDCEDELGNFCTEVGAAVARMARREGVHRLRIAGALLDLDVADRYGLTQELPGIAAGLVTGNDLGAFEALFREKLGRRAEPHLGVLAGHAARMAAR